MKTVRFLEERTETKNGGRTFEAGSVHCLEDPSALHWVKRGAAEYVTSEETTEAANIVEIDTTDFSSTPMEYVTGVLEAPVQSEFRDNPSDAAETEGEPDGNAVDSPAAVVETNSGDSGERAVDVAPRRRGRARGSSAGNRGQSNVSAGDVG